MGTGCRRGALQRITGVKSRWKTAEMAPIEEFSCVMPAMCSSPPGLEQGKGFGGCPGTKAGACPLRVHLVPLLVPDLGDWKSSYRQKGGGSVVI